MGNKESELNQSLGALFSDAPLSDDNVSAIVLGLPPTELLTEVSEINPDGKVEEVILETRQEAQVSKVDTEILEQHEIITGLVEGQGVTIDALRSEVAEGHTEIQQLTDQIEQQSTTIETLRRQLLQITETQEHQTQQLSILATAMVEIAKQQIITDETLSAQLDGMNARQKKHTGALESLTELLARILNSERMKGEEESNDLRELVSHAVDFFNKSIEEGTIPDPAREMRGMNPHDQEIELSPREECDSLNRDLEHFSSFVLSRSNLVVYKGKEEIVIDGKKYIRSDIYAKIRRYQELAKGIEEKPEIILTTLSRCYEAINILNRHN
jgi:translation initiation factor 2 beta subunit (eIF-2beta)/eIF-5